MLASVGIKKALLVIGMAAITINAFSQADSSKNDLTFDLGITRGRNINLWPIFKRFKNTERKELQILFPIYSQNTIYQPKSKHLQLVPFFINDSSSQGIDNRLLSLYYPTLFHYQRRLLNDTLISSYKFLELAPNISCVGISRSPDGIFVENNLLFFLWYKHDNSLQKTHLVVFPIFWYFANRYDTTQLFLPLYYKKTGLYEQKLNIGLLYNQKKDTYENRHVFFPIYWNKKEYQSNDTIYKNTFFPIYWSTKSQTKDNTILFPLVYSLKNSYYQSLTVLPLFSTGHSGDFKQSHLDLLQIYWQFHSPEQDQKVLFPVWWNTRQFKANDTLTTDVLFPLYWSKNSKTSSYQVLLPLLYHFKDPEKESLTFLPLFSWGQSADLKERYLAITPVYWHLRHTGLKQDVVFPLYWRKVDYQLNDTIKKNTLFPVYWSTRSQLKNNKVLFPLVYSLKNPYYQSLTVLPLFSTGHSGDFKQSHLDLLQIYWQFHSPEQDQKILLPIWWNTRQFTHNDTLTTDVLFPLYWSKSSKTGSYQILLPVLYHFKDPKKESLTLLPLFTWGQSADLKNKHLAITPIYWHFQHPGLKQDIVFPLYWRRVDYHQNDTIRKNTLFPVYWSTKSNLKNNKVFFPVLFSLKDQYYQSLTVLPLFSVGHNADNTQSHREILQVYWNIYTHESKTAVIFPLWWDNQKYTLHDTIYRKALIPFYYSINSNEKSNRILLPLVYQLENRYRKSFTVLPLFSWGENFDDKSRYLAITPLYWHLKDEKTTKDILFPIYWRNEIYKNQDTIRKNRLFPVYWSKTSSVERNRVLFPLVYSFKNNYSHSLTVLPIFSVGHATDSSRRYVDILQLYWHLQSTSRDKNVIFPIWWNTREFKRNDTLTTNVLFPLYWAKNSKNDSYKVLIPVLYHFKDQKKESLTLLPFFTWGQSADLNNKHLAVTPIYWHFQHPGLKQDIIFPFYWRKVDYKTNDTIRKNTLFPVYWSTKSQFKNNKVLFPFVYSLKNPSYQSLSVLPLFSAGHSTDSSQRYFEIMELYWHIQSKNKDNRVLFPVYWSLNSEKQQNIVLFPLVYNLVDEYRKSFTIFPIFSNWQSSDSSRSCMAITPVYWHLKQPDQKRDILFPVLWTKKEYKLDDTTRKVTLFPLFWSVVNKEKSNQILFPVLYILKDYYYHSFTFFPVLSFGHSPDATEKHLMITPLSGYFKNPEKTTAYFFPVYNYKKTALETKSSVFFFLFRRNKQAGYSKTSVLWPIGMRIKSEHLNTFRIAPIIWFKKTDTTKMISVQPFQYSYQSPNRKTFILLWFLYKHENLSDSLISNSIIWKVYNHDRYSNGDFETRFLYLIYANINLQGKREKSLLPFYHQVSYANGDQSKSVCFAFYNYFRQYKPEIKEFYEEQRIFWFIRFRSNYAKLKSEGKGDFIKRR